tara:strand:- start:10005 stop:10154 length:150 start_codon:yes stop_codon:yes gene_type:complete
LLRPPLERDEPPDERLLDDDLVALDARFVGRGVLALLLLDLVVDALFTL